MATIKDRSPMAPLRILSLDGGGVRGYAMFMTLREIMHHTFINIHGRAPDKGRNEELKPCDHFDLIVGTGIGGLIALMLGRLRLCLPESWSIFNEMIKLVFESDKTIAGLPYRSTLFKASKLEEAIRSCVRDHTVLVDEGNDEEAGSARFDTPLSPTASIVSSTSRRFGSSSSRSSHNGKLTRLRSSSTTSVSSRGGNPDGLLYDRRPHRTKTAVTAVYKGSPKNGDPGILLRTYDSRKEAAPEFDCAIWQAGRATSATAVFFKPIRIGHSTFLDDGAGTFNPAPQALDEAVVNEWPGREVGIFVSIGTGIYNPVAAGKGRSGWEDFLSSSLLSHFAEARNRLIFKSQECETIHQAMIKEHLPKRNVPIENYVRLDVDFGLGQVAINDYNRLDDISTLTKHYHRNTQVSGMIKHAASKLSKIKIEIEAEAVGAGSHPFQQDQTQNRHGADGSSIMSRSSIEHPGNHYPSSKYHPESITGHSPLPPKTGMTAFSSPPSNFPSYRHSLDQSDGQMTPTLLGPGRLPVVPPSSFPRSGRASSSGSQVSNDRSRYPEPGSHRPTFSLDSKSQRPEGSVYRSSIGDSYPVSTAPTAPTGSVSISSPLSSSSPSRPPKPLAQPTVAHLNSIPAPSTGHYYTSATAINDDWAVGPPPPVNYGRKPELSRPQ